MESLQASQLKKLISNLFFSDTYGDTRHAAGTAANRSFPKGLLLAEQYSHDDSPTSLDAATFLRPPQPSPDCPAEYSGVVCSKRRAEQVTPVGSQRLSESDAMRGGSAHGEAGWRAKGTPATGRERLRGGEIKNSKGNDSIRGQESTETATWRSWGGREGEGEAACNTLEHGELDEQPPRGTAGAPKLHQVLKCSTQ